MKFSGSYEFRGFSEVKSSKEDKVYHFVNLEDETGENVRFFVDSHCSSIYRDLKKGDRVIATFNYSAKYGSISLYDLMEGAKNGK